jgi:hypothetical protein
MNKINGLVLSFLAITYSQVSTMGTINIRSQAEAVINVMTTFQMADNIKKRFLGLEDYARDMKVDKVSEITALLESYQRAHVAFIRSRVLCNPEDLAPKYLKEYYFCDFPTQDIFQAKADALLGGYILDVHQYFEEMRSAEYEALLIPYRLING